ncbi:signal peptidase I [Massilibacteroides sp.]|uniref:signal peptidase I n=1 Tax=Massilibacteroides sp. TaxID=2034766 RepID=UPI0026223281|nr:signal peptidase I [Massilibacteroides sp.]MDD4515897.1 signal peptidase I [Massilibacteroides sp.]
MQDKQKIKTTVKLLLFILFLIAVVVAIRFYLIESYRISTTAMENSLKKGDFILVNKSNKQPKGNQVILFVSPLLKDSASTPLFLSRCIGLPGDTIRIAQDGYTINGRYFPLSPNTVCQYNVDNAIVESFLNVMKRLEISVRNQKQEEKNVLLSLTPFEEYSIREELDEQTNKLFTKLYAEEYTLVVPRKNRPYRLTPENLTACKEAILHEAELSVSFRDQKLFMDGKETNFFFFRQDYYWVLSDNTKDGIDSRHLGFIPADNILGTAWWCWFSQQSDHLFKPVY